MQPIVSADWLQPGDVVYHVPRQHFYELLHRTLIKSEVKGTSWLQGWCYQEVKSVETDGKNSIRHEPPAGEVYSRPTSMFDGDWRLVLPSSKL